MKLDMVDNKKQTPLHIAADRGYLTMVELLLEFGKHCHILKADILFLWKLVLEFNTYLFVDLKVNAQDRNGNCPLHLAQMQNSRSASAVRGKKWKN